MTVDLLRLVMIVKDESAQISSTLESVKPFVDSWFVVDTGSTDGTQAIIKHTMGDKPGVVVEHPPVDYKGLGMDYAETRNVALELAGNATFYLMLDAGDVLDGGGDLREFCRQMQYVGTPCYQIAIGADTTTWSSRRLLKPSPAWRYSTPRHERLTGPGQVGTVIPRVAITNRCGDPLRRMLRWPTDLVVLSDWLKDHPDDRRARFYLAQTAECLGEFMLAHGEYMHVATETAVTDHDVQEQAVAYMRAARSLLRIGPPSKVWPDVQNLLLKSYSIRPSRLEPVHMIARHWLDEGNFWLAHLFASAVWEVPRCCKDTLFVDESVYTWRLADVVAQAADRLNMADLKHRAAHRALAANPTDPHLLWNAMDHRYVEPPVSAGIRRRVSCIFPTRGRAVASTSTWPLWKGRASGKHDLELVASIDDDDQETLVAMTAALSGEPDARIVVGKSRGSVDAYNRGLYASTGEIIVQVMDDVEPPQDWDDIACSRLPDPSIPRVLHVSDGTRLNTTKPWLLTILIGTVAYFRKCGYMYHPSYAHTFGDDDHSEKVMREGLVTEALDVVFHHRWGGAQRDDTAKRNYSNESAKAGYQALLERRRAGFPDCPDLWGKEPTT